MPNTIKCARLYADAEGESHFDDIEFDMTLDTIRSSRPGFGCFRRQLRRQTFRGCASQKVGAMWYACVSSQTVVRCVSGRNRNLDKHWTYQNLQGW